MPNKIAFRFVLYFLAFYSMIVLASIIVLIYFIIQLNFSFNAYTHIQEIEDISDYLEKDRHNHLVIPEPLKKFAEKSGGVLQLLDEDGKVIQSTNRNEILPTEYVFTDLVTMSNEYRSHIWLLEGGKSMLFTRITESDVLLQQIMKAEGFPFISGTENELLKQHDAFLEQYDQKGHILYTTSANKQKPLSGAELLALSQDIAEKKETKSATILEDGTTAVLRMPNPYYAPFDTAMKHFLKESLIVFGIFHAVLFLFIIGFSLWIGQRLGRPVFYFMKKIEKLSRKNYAHIEDRKLRNPKTGQLKKKYRIYDGVDQSLMTLAKNLEENELKIKKTDQLREDWITGLSHDLKTPLSSIYGYSMMLRSNHQWTSEEVRNFALVMEEKASYMDRLINDLTYTYQLKNDGVLLEKEKVEFREFIRESINIMDTNAITYSREGPAIFVFIDPMRFRRVLDNIIGNALKHNRAETPVAVKIQLENHLVMLEVEDQGEGMSAHTMKNLFDRYYRGTNTTTGDKGTGLGLTIAKQLVEAHNGRINVTSNEQGTTIKVILPQYDILSDEFE